MAWIGLSSACTGGIDSPSVDDDGLASAGRGGSGAGGGGNDAGRGSTPVVALDAGVGGSASAVGSGSAEPPDSGGEVVDPPPRMYCDAITEVFQFKCGPSCHQNRDVLIGDFALGLEEARKYINRVSVREASCGLIIDPNDPQESLIVRKVTGDFPRNMNCGSQMPTGSFEITEEEIACIEDWVEQFAR